MNLSENIEKLIRELNVLKANPTKQLDERILQDALKFQKELKTRLSAPQSNIRSIILRNPITKLAAAAVIIIVLLISIEYFGGKIDIATAAFGRTAERVQKAKTISWTGTYISEGRESARTKVRVMEPYFMRLEISDGRILILDQKEGKAIILDPTTRSAEIISTINKHFEVEAYDTFKNFQQPDKFFVKRLSTEIIGIRKLEVFELTAKDKNLRIKVWVDPKTELPFRMESNIESTSGKPPSVEKTITIINSDIVFDEEMDKSLFSTDKPEGYELKKIEGPVKRTDKSVERVQSASKMYNIIQSCIKYVNEHNGDWPDSLDNLKDYGITDNTLINPRHPESKTGYCYIKPSDNSSISTVVVLYELYDNWPEGINVGFADCHVEFVISEENFKQMLKK